MSTQNRLYIFLLLLVFSSCQKDSFITGTETMIDDPVIIVSNTSLVVYVKDQWRLSPFAEVSMHGETYVTDEMGRVFIPLDQVSATGDLITISDIDRITITKKVLLTPGQKNILQVHLEKPSFRYGNSSTDTVFFNTSQFEIVIPSYGFEYEESGEPYDGEYRMEFKFLEGTDPGLLEKMPGNLYAENKEREVYDLQSAGMVRLEFTSDDGRELQLREGVKAKLIFKVSNSLEVIFPPILPPEYLVPFFSLNESTLYWEEEGQAKYTEKGLEFEVSHFSWWACNLYKCIEDIVIIQGTIISQDGSPCSGCLVEIAGATASTEVRTSSQGTFSRLSCPNESYDIKVFSNEINCDESNGHDLGSYSVGDVGIDWGEMNINDNEIISISGNIFLCGGTDSEEGSFIVVNGTEIIETVSNGVFDFFVCYSEGSTITIEGYTQSGLLKSELLEVTLSSSGNHDIVLNTCNESDVYLKIWRDGNQIVNVGQVAQESICVTTNRICLGVNELYYNNEYMAGEIEFEGDINLLQVIRYEDVIQETIFLTDIDLDDPSVGGYLGKATVYDVVDVLEYGDYITVNLVFTALAGPSIMELNYEVEFRIKI